MGLSIKGSTRLVYWHWWLLLGGALVALVIYLSLSDIRLPQVPSGFGDKVNHLIAYGVLTVWFGQLFLAWNKRAVVAVALIALGVSMEFMQGMTAYRVFEWQDAFANLFGVVLGLAAIALGADRILLWFETRFFK